MGKVELRLMSSNNPSEQQPHFKIVGIRFTNVGKIYHFDASHISDIAVGDMIIVETSRGKQIGKVINFLEEVETVPDVGWKPVERKATPVDLLQRESWKQKEEEAVEICRKKVLGYSLIGIKIVAAEYSLDGSRLTILFSSESEEKIDLKNIRHDIQQEFSPAQIELKQIGPRDVAKIMGGMGACGLECRCCSKFLLDFSSISIRMAKEQGISLTPTEITGMCGRLRCCLIYEYDHYVELRKKLPKRNKRIGTPFGEGKVIDVFPLREAVLVDIPEVGIREIAKNDIKSDGDVESAPLKPADTASVNDNSENGDNRAGNRQSGEQSINHNKKRSN